MLTAAFTEGSQQRRRRRQEFGSQIQASRSVAQGVFQAMGRDPVAMQGATQGNEESDARIGSLRHADTSFMRRSRTI